MVQVAQETTLATLLRNYASYNLWANTQLVHWLQTKPVERMEQEVPSSFPSLRLTLLHIWQIQGWWLGNLQKVPSDFVYGQPFYGAMEDIFNGIIEQSEAFVAFVESLPDSSLQENYAFSIPTVGEFALSGFEIIQHCMNHSTYHRGQLITIARNLGFTDAPMTDYMFYLLMA